MKKPTLALIIPCYNEELVIQETISKLSNLVRSLIAKSEISSSSFIVCVDDGSKDSTWEKISNSLTKNRLIKGLKLSKNFGHQYALLAGLEYSFLKSDCMISLDADLQHDINSIVEFVKKFKKGADIVYGVRNNRKEDGLLKRNSSLFFYWLMRVMGVKIIKNHADYRLVSSRVMEVIKGYDERNLFLRGIFSDVGFTSDIVYFDVKPRFAGNSKYSLRRMISFALNGITSFTIMPLRMVSCFGLIIFSISLVMAFYVYWAKTFSDLTIPGWASIVIPIYLLSGIQMLCLGVVGEYIGKMYLEVKHRPRYIIEKEV